MIVRCNGKQKTLDKRLKSKTFCARVVYATLLATYAGTRHDYVRRLRIAYQALWGDSRLISIRRWLKL